MSLAPLQMYPPQPSPPLPPRLKMITDVRRMCGARVEICTRAISRDPFVVSASARIAATEVTWIKEQKLHLFSVSAFKSERSGAEQSS